MSLLLILDRLHILIGCLHCWLWTSIWPLEEVFLLFFEVWQSNKKYIKNKRKLDVTCVLRSPLNTEVKHSPNSGSAKYTFPKSLWLRAETVTRRWFMKNLFFKNLLDSQENIWKGVFLIIQLQILSASLLILLKKRLYRRGFPVNIEILRRTFIWNTFGNDFCKSHFLINESLAGKSTRNVK